MSFNLTPPPGFRGFDEAGPLTVYSRLLPHWRQPGATYFVTFHLADSIPEVKRRELAAAKEDWERRHPHPDDAQRTEYARSMFQKVEDWLDAGSGACWFRDQCYANELQRALLHFHDKRYEMGCFTIMANHCHLIMRPFDGISLEKEVGMIKQVVARFINRRRGEENALWHEESYDRIIRDEEHLYRVLQYIGSNPRRAGVPREQWLRWIDPRWVAHGWNFVD